MVYCQGFKVDPSPDVFKIYIFNLTNKFAITHRLHSIFNSFLDGKIFLDLGDKEPTLADEGSVG